MCWDTLRIGTAASKRCALCCNSIVSVQIAVECCVDASRRGTCSAAPSCEYDCVLQVTFGRSHWEWYIEDAIWMSRFAGNFFFQLVNGCSVAEESRLACATDAAILALSSIPVRFARAGTEGSRWLFCLLCGCWLCFACVATLFCSRSCWHVYMPCLPETCIGVIWLSGFQQGACSCSAHAHVGMFKWHVCSKPA